MYIFEESFDELDSWMREEITIDETISQGAHGLAARRVQEWLKIHGFDLVVDGDYGSITTRCVAQFQETQGHADTGDVDPITFDKLVAPMIEVLQQRLDQSMSYEDAVLQYAAAHLEQHPVEVGGQNRGPWVRLYMKGIDGVSRAWCAGFVTFIMRQAAQSLQMPTPFRGSFSCDSMAAQAKEVGLFRAGSATDPGDIPAGSIFLVRASETDWTHTGFVTDMEEEHFDTVEGNTNDDGNREGYEVCARTRGHSGKDFLVLTATS